MYDLLKGIRVVEGASFIATPLCGLTLVQLGADVIRFDPIGGGLDFDRWPLASNGLSFYWEGLNKGKRSIALNLRDPRGREIAVALVTAQGRNKGCFVTNYPAGGFLAHERLAAKRPDLITVRVTGSSDGRNALDYTVNCAAGYPYMTGPADMDEPINHVLPAWDIAAGLTAAVSLLAALRSRDAGGGGAEVQVPLSNVAFSTLSTLGNIGEIATGGADRERYGNALYGSFGRDFVTADGHRLMIVAMTEKQWTGLMAALELDDDVVSLERQLGVNFTNDTSARFVHREPLFALVGREVARRRLQQLAGLLDQHGACWGLYQTVSQGLSNDRRLSTANPMFQSVAHPSGETYIAAGFPGIFCGVDRQPVRAAPRLGANTEEVLANELGMSAREIALLHDANVVTMA